MGTLASVLTVLVYIFSAVIGVLIIALIGSASLSEFANFLDSPKSSSLFLLQVSLRKAVRSYDYETLFILAENTHLSRRQFSKIFDSTSYCPSWVQQVRFEKILAENPACPAEVLIKLGSSKTATFASGSSIRTIVMQHPNLPDEYKVMWALEEAAV